MYQLPRLTNNTTTFLCDTVISYGEPPPFETFPLDPLALPPPPPPPPPAPIPVLDCVFHQTQMDTIQEQLQVMYIDAVEDNQDQDQDADENMEMIDASVDEFGFAE
ncbi:MAG: hypothetical protein J3R72DRAFT_425541 [Linnemannia gamsii]|nr:MAG: hypothetical protein J3R72DRAFT_425541 [Linnemannia gamsii]